MKVTTVKNLWDALSEDWYKSATVIGDDGIECSVAMLCAVKRGYHKIVWKRYNMIKDIVKKHYFGDKQKFISRYKRAAILAYAISAADPLIYKVPPENGIDSMLLKQRLAVHIALASLYMDIPKEFLTKAKHDSPNKKIFNFDRLGNVDNEFDKLDGTSGVSRDSFIMSVYRDLFFAEIYENFNVLTMANVFGLLVENASCIPLAVQYALEERKT